jgi:mannitol/fructose-specific phosphotransferase system IIA component (Ntr-type)
MVDNPVKAREAADFLHTQDVEIVFLYVSTYALSSTVLPVAQKLKVPVVILNLQPVAELDYEAFNQLGDRGKMTATERLAEQLVSAGVVLDPQRLNAVIRNTWPEDMVTVGEHAFLPHFRTESVRELVAALGVAREPVRLEKAPNRRARIVILLVAPPRETTTYLQVLGALARALSSAETVDKLLTVESAEQVVSLAGLAGVELPSHLTVRDVMTTRVFSIQPGETLGTAARFMLEHDIRALPVVADGGELLGIVTHM